MKRTTQFITTFLSAAILLSSCSREFNITKRHYTGGYYIDYAGKQNSPKHKEIKIVIPEQFIGVSPKTSEPVNVNIESSATTNTAAKQIHAGKQNRLTRHSANKIPTNIISPNTTNKAFHAPAISTIASPQAFIKNAFQLQESSDAITHDHDSDRGLSLLWLVIVIILILWLIGIIAGGFGLGGLINLLLIIALVLLILWLLRLI